jgi:hypothetical protein
MKQVNRNGNRVMSRINGPMVPLAELLKHGKKKENIKKSLLIGLAR